MITLYRFGPAFGIRELGPFVLKTISYLRLADIEFSQEIQSDPRKAPKGKIPYINHDGKEIGDSSFIIEYLKTHFGDPLNAGLTPEQLAIGHAMKVMLEERTYWAGMIYPRWIKKDHHKMMAQEAFKAVPGLLRGTVFRMVASALAKSADGHGIGKHTDAEIFELGIKDWQSVETLLGEKNFMLGDTPAEVDCTVYAFLHGMNADVFDTPIQKYIKASPKLQAYHARMDKAVFGED